MKSWIKRITKASDNVAYPEVYEEKWEEILMNDCRESIRAGKKFLLDRALKLEGENK